MNSSLAKGPHNEAILYLSSVFPSFSFSSLEQAVSLHELVQKISRDLPIPDSLQQHKVLATMKVKADQQEYKIQRNMMELQEERIQGPNRAQIEAAGIEESQLFPVAMSKQISEYTNEDSSYLVFQDEKVENWWVGQANMSQQDYLKKECFSYFD